MHKLKALAVAEAEQRVVSKGDTEGEKVETLMTRFRTMGDATITGAVLSDADNLDAIIEEVAAARETERGNRADDKRSETSMEDRKKEGYF